jgi:hypothetical protein
VRLVRPPPLGDGEPSSILTTWTLASPNLALQRTGTHKVLGRGRPASCAYGRWRARVLRGRRAAAELGSYGYNLGCLEGVEPSLVQNVPVNDGVNHPADRKT